MQPTDLATRVEMAERAAALSFYRAAPSSLAAEHGIECLDVSGAACVVVRALDNRMFSRTLALGVDAPADEPVLDRVDAFFGDAPHVHAVSPVAQPSDLRERLQVRGFTPDYAWMRFAREVDGDLPEPRTDLAVRRVGRHAAADFARVVLDAYGMPSFMKEWLAEVPARPGWHCFLAYAGDRPAGAGALFIHESTGWLGFGGTVPEMRGRGAQGAVLAARLRAAQEAGCDLLTTETGVRGEGRPAISYRNILRAGFRELYERPNLRSP